MKLPPPLRQLYDGWMIGSEALGRIMSWILLTALWVVGFGIYAIVLKVIVLFRSAKTPVTYWVPLPPEPGDGMIRPF